VVENGVREIYSARYYNPQTGRFLSRDPEDGKALDPKTLHKYLYAGGDPVNRIDPMGREVMFEYLMSQDLTGPDILSIKLIKSGVCVALGEAIQQLVPGPLGWGAGTGAGLLLCLFWM
jgi:RHS repeat-associated protein